MRRLVLFDLDHTLLSGDSDVLWVDFLARQGLLDMAVFGPANEALQRDYKQGRVGVTEFVDFYASTLAGRKASEVEPLLARFLVECIVPNIPAAARELVDVYRADANNVVVLTTATQRTLTTRTAKYLGIDHLLATETGIEAGVHTGRSVAVPNMRQGKVTRLHAWLEARGEQLADYAEVYVYSDSINDLPLLCIATHPNAVDPDEKLFAEANARGWRVLRLARGGDDGR